MNQIDKEKYRLELERRYQRIRRSEIGRQIVLIVTLLVLGGGSGAFLLSDQGVSRPTVFISQEQIYRDPAVFWSTYQKEEKLVRQIGLQAELEQTGKPIPVILAQIDRCLRRDMNAYIKQGYNEAALFVITRDFKRFAMGRTRMGIEDIWSEYCKSRGNISRVCSQAQPCTIRNKEWIKE